MDYYLGTVSNILGVVGAIFAFFAWLQSWSLRDDIRRETARQAQDIRIKLLFRDDGREITLPLSLKRRELSRAELLGRIGMMPMREAGKRFSLAYLSTPGFLDQINSAQQAGYGYEIMIPCSQAEFDQFSL